ncbi:hypothetical protein F5887DRAFT_1072595 [Amanita rubescens]|nr:hypothetical protein F5887DRAFT_1072595 [Amanita rubescens]
MKTTLPTLSYNPTGFVWFEDFHSSAYTKERAFPRTDLEHLVRWDTFETEINDAIGARMSAMNIPLGAEYDLGPLRKKRPRVTDEEAVRRVAEVQLHDLVVDVLGILGIEGWFSSPSGKNQIVGEPDFSWLRDTTMHPRVVSTRQNGRLLLEDLPAYFRRKAHKNANLNVRERQSIDAVFQLYGYMTFNDNKYGILSNMQYAWFFQRILETADNEGKNLQYYGPIKFDVDSDHSPSMLKAFVGTILLAETDSIRFHSSPTPAKAPDDRYFGVTLTAIRNRDAAIAEARSYHSVVVNGSYQVLPLDPRLCHFDRSAVRHVPRRGSTLKAKLERGILAGGNLNVFCKIVDLFQRRDSIDALNLEARNYATLFARLLALEDVGTAIPEDGEIDTQTRALMRSALARIHSAGYVHGDIARRNFCKKGGVVYLVDLETLAAGNLEQMNDELAQINKL